MQVSDWEFHPGLWPSLAALVLVPALISLGFWQLHRADEKQALERTWQARRAAPPLDLAALSPAGRGQAEMGRRAELRGGYVTGEQYLLDNQVVGGEPGYFVYTPFRLADNAGVVLVNRGWIPMGARRSSIPDVPPPAGAPVTGTVKAPQSTGLVLDGAAMEELGRGLVRVQQLDLAAVARRLEQPLPPYVVRVDAGVPGGLVRDWPEPGFGREKHLGYAFQWFAMAAAVVILYVALNLRRKQRHE